MLTSMSRFGVRPNFIVGLKTSQVSVFTPPMSWNVAFTRSASIWKWPGSTVHVLSDLVGRSVQIGVGAADAGLAAVWVHAGSGRVVRPSTNADQWPIQIKGRAPDEV